MMAFRAPVTAAMAVVRVAVRRERGCPPLPCRFLTPGRSGLGISAQGHALLEHLLRQEEGAEALYRELSEKTTHEGFRRIFGMLAQEEAKHREWVRQLTQDGELGPAVQQSDDILGDVAKIVATMKLAHKSLSHLASNPDNTEPVDLYRMAAVLEAQSEEFYKARAEVAEDPAVRRLLEVIAAEEGKHYKMVSGLLESITQDDETREMEQPNLWVRPREDFLAEMGKM